MMKLRLVSTVGLAWKKSKDDLKWSLNKYKARSTGTRWRGRIKQSSVMDRSLVGIQCTNGFGDPVPQESTKQQVSETGEWIADRLESINVVLIGDNTDLNFALGSVLAPALKYTPLHTPLILQQFKNKTITEIVSEDGEDELGLSEAMVFESFSGYLRCVISTCGNGIGAAARAACWRYIFGALTIWIDSKDAAETKLQDEAYSQCDIQIRINAKNDPMTNEHSTDPSALASAILPQVLSAIKSKIKEECELCKKKGLYVRLGCRGDWPNIKPPDWRQ